jgi:hypothetical protein
MAATDGTRVPGHEITTPFARALESSGIMWEMGKPNPWYRDR